MDNSPDAKDKCHERSHDIAETTPPLFRTKALRSFVLL